MLTDKAPFAETVYRLRNNEELIIFEKNLSIKATEETYVNDFLEAEYDNEALDYPYTAPVFDAGASMWAARIIYFSAQLLLFREETTRDIPVLFAAYPGTKSPSVFLSADICLRFLPDLLHKLKQIDPDDILVKTLEQRLQEFPYSAVGYFDETGLSQDEYDFSDDCYRQLFVDRVIEKRDYKTASRPAVKTLIESALGDHEQFFWPLLNK